MHTHNNKMIIGSGVVKWLGGLLSRGQVTAEEAFLCIYADS